MARRKLTRAEECRALRLAFLAGNEMGCTPVDAIKRRAKAVKGCGRLFSDPTPAAAAPTQPDQAGFASWSARWMHRD